MKDSFNFEKHRKRLRRKTLLNFLGVFLVASGLGFLIGEPVNVLLGIAGFNRPVMATGLALGAAWLILWSIPLLHFREEVVTRYEGDIENVKGLSTDLPTVEVLLDQGWDMKEAGEEYLVLQTYPSRIHRFIGRAASIRMEIEETSEKGEKMIMSQNGKELEELEYDFSEDEDVTIESTGRSLRRVSLSYLEPLMFMLPEMKDMIEDFDEDIEIQDVNMEISLTSYDS